MLKITKLTDYGMVLLTNLAQHAETQHTARQIALQTHLTLPTVSKLLKILAKKGILTSTRGALGGYGLAREPAAMTVAEMIAALEGDLAITECNHAQSRCHVETWCSARGSWHFINHIVHTALSQITLADMVSQACSTLHQTAQRPIHFTERLVAHKKVLS